MTTTASPRKRIKREYLHDRPRQPKLKAASAEKRKRFTVLPRAFIEAPGKSKLTVYETGVLAALIAGAHERDYADRKAIADSAKAAAFRKSLRRDRNDMKAAQMASKNAWRASMARQAAEDAPSETLTFRAYATELLTMAGLSTSSRSLARLGDALTRMQRNIVEGLPAPLIRAARLKSGRYKFVVDSEWIEKPHRRVNLPLPTKSLHATNLFLFKRTLTGNRTIELAELCKALGIKSRKPFEQRRLIEHAFDTSHAMFFQHGSDIPTPRIPIAWRLDWIGAGRNRVRLTPGYLSSE